MSKIEYLTRPYRNPSLVGAYATGLVWGVLVDPWLGLGYLVSI